MVVESASTKKMRVRRSGQVPIMQTGVMAANRVELVQVGVGSSP